MIARKKAKAENPFFEMDFEEAISRLAQTDKGELEKAIAHDIIERVARNKKRVEDAREDIARGARTRPKKDRFRL
ncbi:hypothetical protein FJ417_02100 [Mesorhizobium sp. B3-1-7]|uniref:hypothetical protein n=1 Tax=Mesorhizobium sp. B3-1-7 TaxID=2589894 RepID=UPI001127F3BF|nr:hypothetical protein [Mesorhizobium sp. B3-1-7]TPI64448.1 hypothetical protein FJ417_02100 [Mesorhizobium sp. B3-1-7]